MAVKKIYDMCVGKKYTAKDGTEKTQWQNIGAMFIGDDNSIWSQMSAVPVGNWDGHISYFERKPRDGQGYNPNNPGVAQPIQQQQPAAQPMQAAPAPSESDLPF